ncbi:hypothetical protein D3C73_957920 [compost metagenome]
MHGTCASAAVRHRCCLQVDDVTEIGGRTETDIAVTFINALKPQGAGQRIRRPVRVSAVQNSAAEAFDRMLYRYSSERPGAERPVCAFHQLNPQPVIIREGEVPFRDPSHMGDRNLVSGEPLLPEAQRAFRHRISGYADLPAADTAFASGSPREEGNNGTWSTRFIPEIEMVHLRDIKIDRLFNQSQAKNSGIEISVALRVLYKSGNMVNPCGLKCHEFHLLKVCEQSFLVSHRTNSHRKHKLKVM